jgi:hypothetical protein
MTRAGRAIAWSLLVGACAREEGQHHELDGLTVIEDFDPPICAGTFPYFEHRLDWLERATGLPRDPKGLTYRWLFDGAALEAVCGSPLGGCAIGRTFYGDLFVFSHELAHAHLARLGYPRPWLTEGMATMMEDQHSGAPHPLFTPTVMMRLDKARDIDYAAAAAFTRYLSDRYGMALLLDYYETAADADEEMSRMLFAEVFGDSFADIEADYLDGGLPTFGGSLDCDGPENVAWSDDTWEHSFRLACDEPGSIGPERDPNDPNLSPSLWSKVTMTAPPGWIALDLDASGPSYVSVLQCEGAEVVHVATVQPHAEALLTGGRYLVYATASTDDAPSARLTARSIPAPSTPSTKSLSPGSSHQGPAPSRRCAGATDI